MIQSTIPLLYDARNGQKQAIIEIIVPEWTVNELGITYVVHDYAITGEIREFIPKDNPDRFRSWDQLNSLNDYLESTYDYSGMTKKEMEFAKLKHGLLLEAQTKPVFGSQPNQWVIINNSEE